MSTTTGLMALPVPEMPGRPALPVQPRFPVYERLQLGETAVSLQAILDENPMLGVTVAQQINSGSIEILDLAIDSKNRELLDLRVRLRALETTSPFRQDLVPDESGSDSRTDASTRSLVRQHAASGPLDVGEDWTLQLLLRDLHDAHAALDSRMRSSGDWELLLDDQLALQRVGQSQPVLLAWNATEPVGREQLTVYEAWPRGWKRHLALLTAIVRAAARVTRATSDRRISFESNVVHRLRHAFSRGANRHWLICTRPVTN